MRLVLPLAAMAGVAAYLRYGRPRVLNWNATPEEIASTLPGDEILPDAPLVTTRAISVHAPPAAIWPWLLQMGPKPRGGVYTYDWIERLLGIDIKNSDRILPEFQHLEPGEWIGVNKEGQGIRVVDVLPERAIVLQWVPAGSTWTFAIEPQDDGTTRLISRNRIKPSGPLAWLGMVAVMEAGSLVMERKMLMGIRDRAERLARNPAACGLTTLSAPAAG